MSAGGTGNRCEIYEKIDALDAVRSVAELVSRLKPILSELAYYAVTGEAAVMETREEWHTQYTDALYSETASDSNGGRAAAAATPARSAASRVPKAARGRGDGDRRGQAAPPSNRPRPRDLPPSLRAIMEGAHPSFNENGEK